MRAHQERAAKAEELQRRIQETVGAATTDDDRLTVSYSEANGIEELTIDPRMLRMGSEELAAEIKRVTNLARDDVQEQINTIVTEAFADGAPDPRQVLEQLPDFEKTMDEILRDTQTMGTEVVDIVERMRRQAES
ncbi:YbaB/EbfC family nucleoid-associated protein [Actinopolymorpha alba]|uniref:YbaB/EbfC family nucleoid-associated protein n=1 Tax=Actinopolymorpha alba TaxID=533267 RepID=UPI001ED9C3F4|nr:YbaB/EbfC family nucleoid-associated protein [Actinopolymorpha alba]